MKNFVDVCQHYSSWNVTRTRTKIHISLSFLSFNLYRIFCSRGWKKLSELLNQARNPLEGGPSVRMNRLSSIMTENWVGQGWNQMQPARKDRNTVVFSDPIKPHCPRYDANCASHSSFCPILFFILPPFSLLLFIHWRSLPQKALC